MVHEPGEPLDKWHTSFDRRMLKAETLWEAGARVGKKSIAHELAGHFPFED